MNSDDVIRSAAQLAQHLRRCGVQQMPIASDAGVDRWTQRFETPEKSTPAPAPRSAKTQPSAKATTPTQPPAATQRRLEPVEAVESAADPYPGPPLSMAQRETHFAELSANVAACTRCPALVACRQQTVFGEGNLQPRFAFFGEGPGADEDRTGRPFVGRAGVLLTKMIEACTLKREDVYILNTVKCRPPGNRNPEPSEVDHCRQYFEDQLSTLRPEFIVCLGAVAAQSLLRSKLSVGRLRGRLHRYHDSKVIVTYHPAYLLRNPQAKRAAWDDLQMMLREAGIRLPSKNP